MPGTLARRPSGWVLPTVFVGSGPGWGPLAAISVLFVLSVGGGGAGAPTRRYPFCSCWVLAEMTRGMSRPTTVLLTEEHRLARNSTAVWALTRKLGQKSEIGETDPLR